MWKYAVDNGCLMCECDFCGKRMILYPYTYKNNYLFCPYCGQQNLLVPDDVTERQHRIRNSDKDGYVV